MTNSKFHKLFLSIFAVFFFFVSAPAIAIDEPKTDDDSGNPFDQLERWFSDDKPKSDDDSGNPFAKWFSEDSELGATYVMEVYGLLKATYVRSDSITFVDCMNSALWGASEVLEKHKVKYVPAPLDEDMDAFTAVGQFYVQFNRAQELSAKADDLGKNELAFGAVDAMLKSLKSSHTRFIDPESLKMFTPGEEQTIGGIGVVLGRLNPDTENFFYAEWVLKGGPADKAGLRRFDRITAVNGDPLPADLIEASRSIRGDVGTVVTLTIERAGDEMELEITRGEVSTPSTDCSTMEVDGYTFAYVHIFQFDSETVSKAVAYLKSHKAVDGVILDLRGNPGGELQAVDALLDALLPRGEVAYVMKKGDGSEERVTAGPQVCKAPMVCLLNGESGSGAEITASALKESGRAAIVGEKSGGWVEAATVVPIPLGGGSALMVAIMEIYSSKGENLEGAGVTPTEPVELTEDDIRAGDDIQLVRAQSCLQAQLGLPKKSKRNK